MAIVTITKKDLVSQSSTVDPGEYELKVETVNVTPEGWYDVELNIVDATYDRLWPIRKRFFDVANLVPLLVCVNGGELKEGDSIDLDALVGKTVLGIVEPRSYVDKKTGLTRQSNDVTSFRPKL